MSEKSKEEVLTAKVSTSAYFPKGFGEGSRIVNLTWVKKTTNFLPKEMKPETTMRIGSSFKKGTKDIIRGLSRNIEYFNNIGESVEVNEEKKYLPSIIGVNPTANEWESVVKEFWANFGISVPYEKGIKLEIGFNEDGTPINIEDYIKYKHCIEHSKVAVTDDELDNKDIYDFFIIDEDKQYKLTRKQFEENTKIDIQYLKLINAKDETTKRKVDYILEIAGGPRADGIMVYNLDELSKQMKLKDLRDKFPERFVDLVNDINLATKALIRKAITIGRITKEGDAYFLDEKRIGSGVMETIAYLDNPNNAVVKEKLHEAIKDFVS